MDGLPKEITKNGYIIKFAKPFWKLVMKLAAPEIKYVAVGSEDKAGIFIQADRAELWLPSPISDTLGDSSIELLDVELCIDGITTVRKMLVKRE